MARRHSLLVRFFVFSVLIAGCSIAATAWLATQATTGSIRQEQGEELATGARMYDGLLDYAARHKDWSQAGPELKKLDKATGRRVALTTPERKVIADSGGKDAPELPVAQTAVINPLDVDAELKPNAPADHIDTRAIGPLRLSDAEKATRKAIVEEALKCVREVDPSARAVERPNGRTDLDFTDASAPFDAQTRCPRTVLDEALLAPLPSEERAAKPYTDQVETCLKQTGAQIQLPPNYLADWYSTIPAASPRAAAPPEAAACMSIAKRQFLKQYVAPPALLFITPRTGGAPARTDLTTAGNTRITLTAFAILVVAMLAAWLAAAQFVRPIRAMTAAARRMGSGDRSVRVRAGNGEMGELAAAFNTMSQELEATEEQRKAMVSDVAHELRTPLGNITGWLEATQDGLANPDPELIAMLLKESFLLQYLVSDLQDLAQADAGALRLHAEPIDARDLVDQVAAAHQAQADDNGVVLRAATRGPLNVTADPSRLQQALGNLVSNAIRHTPPGGSVTVSGRRHGTSVVLEVVDTGSGIPPEHLGHVFDRFWRADKSRSRRTGGSGLGLAITRHLAEAHGGTVTAESVVGHGSTFRIMLPVDDGDGPAPPTPPAEVG
ncbi:MAG: two-component system, OmpR family, sensor histidine kinase BaeS, partial [Cryptosporangiaceae bacterium]|nr:two-component system, OmpR family, sensor histidine kinase BaeS [Cryptosporangiaceae bacterium]